MDGYVRLYHFVPEIFGVSNVINRRLKISEFKDMNDPFELLAYGARQLFVRREFRKFKEDFGKGAGLLCFSKSYKSPVQWAHYADRHRGMCLGFDVSRENASEVRYVPGRLSIQSVDFLDPGQSQKFAEDILFTKNSSWSYEQEFRVGVRLADPDENGLHFIGFDQDLILREIIVGASSNMSKASATSLADSLGYEVDTFKVRPAFSTFDMVRNKSDKNWA